MTIKRITNYSEPKLVRNLDQWDDVRVEITKIYLVVFGMFIRIKKRTRYEIWHRKAIYHFEDICNSNPRWIRASTEYIIKWYERNLYEDLLDAHTFSPRRFVTELDIKI